MSEKQRRPQLGLRIAEGLSIIGERTLDQIDRGFIPVEWRAADLAKIKRACHYAIRLNNWRERTAKERAMRQAKEESP